MCKNRIDNWLLPACFTCARCRGTVLCCWRLANEGQPLSDGTQGGILRGVFPRAVQRAVHALVPPTRCCGGHLRKENLNHEQTSTENDQYSAEML